MTEPTLLEMAADVRAKSAEIRAICDTLKQAGAEWTHLALAAGDAAKVASDGLRNAWCVLDRLQWIAEFELKAAKAHAALKLGGDGSGVHAEQNENGG